MQICPNCGRELQEEVNYCPECGFQFDYHLDAIILSRLFGNVEIGGSNLHKLAQDRLWKIGRDFGFMAMSEYEAPDLVEKGRRSFIDIVWKTRSEIAAAFEIRTKQQNLDVVTTQKDMTKLDRFPSKTKFIVNVSETSGKAYFHKISSSPRTSSSQITIQPTTKPISKPNKQREKNYSLEEIRSNYPRAYEKWASEEDAQLTREYKEGLSVSKLVEMHKRNGGAIHSRLVRLGLVEKDAE